VALSSEVVSSLLRWQREGKQATIDLAREEGKERRERGQRLPFQSGNWGSAIERREAGDPCRGSSGEEGEAEQQRLPFQRRN
jgi:hypothetical protein